MHHIFHQGRWNVTKNVCMKSADAPNKGSFGLAVFLLLSSSHLSSPLANRSSVACKAWFKEVVFNRFISKLSKIKMLWQQPSGFPNCSVLFSSFGRVTAWCLVTTGLYCLCLSQKETSSIFDCRDKPGLMRPIVVLGFRRRYRSHCETGTKFHCRRGPPVSIGNWNGTSGWLDSVIESTEALLATVHSFWELQCTVNSLT